MKYLYKSINDYSPREYKEFVNKLPLTFQNKVNSLVKTNNKYQRILGRIILNRLLKSAYNESNIRYNDYGKPLLDNINFNISHSYEYVLAATSNNNIGVDIEKIRIVNLNVMKKICSEDEINDIINSNDKYKSFWIYYTLKEAYTKLLGTGIIDITDAKFKFDSGKYICLNNKKLNIFVSIEIDGYIFSIIYE